MNIIEMRSYSLAIVGAKCRLRLRIDEYWLSSCTKI